MQYLRNATDRLKNVRSTVATFYAVVVVIGVVFHPRLGIGKA